MRSWTEKAVLSLSLYAAAAAGETGWEEAHGTLVRHLSGHAGKLLVRHGNGAMEPLAMPGFSPEARALNAGHYHSVDPWLQAALARTSRQAVLDNDLVPREQFDRSEIWTEYGRTHSRAYYLLGGVVPLDHGATSVIGINRPEGAEAFGPQDRQRLAALVPGLSHSLAVFLRLREALGQAETARLAMDAVATPLAIADAAGLVHFANQAAHEMLARRGAPLRLARARSGRQQIQARGNADAQTLAQAIAAAAAGTLGGAVALAAAEGSRAVTVLAHPLPSPGAKVGLALMLFHDPQQQGQVNRVLLKSLFQLSEAELEVLRALMQGHTAERLAGLRGVSVTTVRTQIRSLLHKTATDNIKALVQVVSSLPGVRGP